MRSYQTGRNFNHPLAAVSVEDDQSAKSLPPTQSFCSVQGSNLVITALKKAETGSSVILRLYEVQGRTTETPVTFLGKQEVFRETNLLEEDSGSAGEKVLHVGPYQIKTVRLQFRAPTEGGPE